MKSAIKAEDILHDIEFELIQGAIRQDELGQSIQAVRKFHNDLRAELLASVQKLEGGRNIVTRQAQFNDMVITLLQEMGNELHNLRQQQRQLNGWARRHPLPGEALAGDAPSQLLGESETDIDSSFSTQNGHPASPFLPLPSLPEPSMPSLARMNQGHATDREVAQSMRQEALALAVDVRPVDVPLVGWILQKIRSAFHSLAFFYAQRLGERQAEVNRIYGDRLLALSQDNAQYQRQLEDLLAEVEQLRRQQTG